MKAIRPLLILCPLLFAYHAFRPGEQLREVDIQASANVTLKTADFCPFSAEDDDFGSYIKTKIRKEYYSHDCPFIAKKYKKCSSEGYAWQNPKLCSLLEVSQFKEYFKNRTLIFWGDSLSEQIFGSLMCLLTPRKSWRANKTRKIVDRREKPRYCLSTSHEIKICIVYARTPIFSLDYVQKLQENDSILLANFGIHYNHGVRDHDEEALRRDAEILANAIPNFKGRFVWRETSAQHFPTEDGSFNQRAARSSYEIKSFSCKDASILNRGWRNMITTPILRNATKNVLEIGSFSTATPAALHKHGPGRDCTHYCAPGVPDDWARIVMNYIYVHKL